MAYVGFDKLKGQLAHRPGVTNPAALAASIGRRKYGKKAMGQAAAHGTSLKGHKRVDKLTPGDTRDAAKGKSVKDRHDALAKYMRQHGRH